MALHKKNNNETKTEYSMTEDKNARVVHCHPVLKVEITGYYR